MAKDKKDIKDKEEKTEKVKVIDVKDINDVGDAIKKINRLTDATEVNWKEVSEAILRAKEITNEQRELLGGINGLEYTLSTHLSEQEKTRINNFNTTSKLSDTLKKQQENVLGSQEKMVTVAAAFGNEYDEVEDLLGNIKKINEGILDNSKELALSASDLLKNKVKEIDISEKSKEIKFAQLQITDKINKYEKEGNFEKAHALKSQLMSLDVSSKNLELQDKQSKALTKHQEKYEHIRSDINGMADKMFGFAENLPVVGKYLSNAFDFGGIKNQINDVISATMQDGISGGIQAMKGLQLATLGWVALIAGVVLIFKALYDVFADLDGKAMDIAKTQGLTADQGREQLKTAHELAGATNDITINSEKYLSAMEGAREALGGMLPTGEKMNDNAKEYLDMQVKLTDRFGMNNKEASDFQEAAASLGVSTEELIGTTALVGKHMEAATGTSMDMNAVMKDIGGMSKSLIATFKGNTAELIRATAKAKALGTSLQRMSEIGEGMLDIESSLSKEMEARVLTGKNLNLDKVRQLKLAGDEAGMMEEILNQAGSLEEFNAMDGLQKQAMADALGMQKDELQGILEKGELQKKLGTDIKNLSNEELQARIKSGELNEGNLKQLAEEEIRSRNTATVNESIMGIWTKIKDVITGMVAGPLGDLAKHIQEFLSDTDKMDGIMNAIKSTFKVLGTLVKISFVPLSIAFNVLSEIFSVISSITSVFRSTNEEASGMGDTIADILTAVVAVGGAILLWKKFLKPAGGMLGKAKDGIMSKVGFGKKKEKGPSMLEKVGKGVEKMDAKKLLAGAAALVLVAGAVFIMAKALAVFSKDVSWEGVAMGIVSLVALTAAVIALGILMKSGVGALAIIAGAAAMLIMAGAMWVLGKAMQQFAIAFNMLIPVLKVGGEIIVAIISSISDGFAKVIDAIGRGLEKFGGIIQTIGEAIAGVVNAIGDNVQKIFGSIKELISIEGGGENLMKMALGLGAIGLALAGLAAVGTADGFVSLFGGGSSQWLDVLKEASEIDGEKIAQVGSGMSGITDALKAVSELNIENAGENLSKIAAGLEGIAVSLGLLADVGTADGFLSLFGGGSSQWLDVLKEASEIDGKKIAEVGSGMLSIAGALKAMSEINVEKIESLFDKLSDVDLEDMAESVKVLKVVKETSNSEEGSSSSSSKSTNAEETDRVTDISGGATDTNVLILEALNKILNSMNQPIIFKMNDTVLGKLDATSALNRQMKMGTDNTYGRTIS